MFLRRVIEEWPRCYSPRYIGAKCRSDLRGWIIYSWIALPTVMYGGYALLRLLTQANALRPFRLTWFRVGHAHAGVLLFEVFWRSGVSVVGQILANYLAPAARATDSRQ
jgi:hypothetical protein